MRKLLISGFDTFNGQGVNPSWETVRALTAAIKML